MLGLPLAIEMDKNGWEVWKFNDTERILKADTYITIVRDDLWVTKKVLVAVYWDFGRPAPQYRVQAYIMGYDEDDDPVVQATKNFSIILEENDDFSYELIAELIHEGCTLFTKKYIDSQI